MYQTSANISSSRKLEKITIQYAVRRVLARRWPFFKESTATRRWTLSEKNEPSATLIRHAAAIRTRTESQAPASACVERFTRHKLRKRVQALKKRASFTRIPQCAHYVLHNCLHQDRRTSYPSSIYHVLFRYLLIEVGSCTQLPTKSRHHADFKSYLATIHVSATRSMVKTTLIKTTWKGYRRLGQHQTSTTYKILNHVK